MTIVNRCFTLSVCFLFYLRMVTSMYLLETYLYLFLFLLEGFTLCSFNLFDLFVDVVLNVCDGATLSYLIGNFPF